MKRRQLLAGGSALAAGALVLPRMSFAAPNRIDWYTSSDQNVLDFWTNYVKPPFEQANPGITINLVDGGDSAGLQALASRALAALGTDKDPQIDFFEGFDARLPVGALDKGLWVDFSKEKLSN
jgi:putative spermidine/putrescine transport system substrate-binding protein